MRITSAAERTLSTLTDKKRLLFDALLAASLLAIALIVYFVIGLMREDGAYADVYVNGELCASYPLDTDGEYPINGGTNIIKIENGRVWMLDADCPDGLCVRWGKISDGGECITCLPNRVVVEIRGEGILSSQ